MKILYLVPHLNTIYAGRTIYNGYKNAFLDKGHDFEFLTANDNQEKKCLEFNPDIIFIGLSDYFLKFLDLTTLKAQRKKGSKVFVSIPLYNSPISRLRLNETPGLANNLKWINLIKSGELGDVFFNMVEEADSRMEGFTKTTGYKHYTVPLAADKTVIYPEFGHNYKADISYVGTNLPEKREFFENYVFPLNKKYDLKLYGQDWTIIDRAIGLISKTGKFFNIPVIKDLQQAKLEIDDERKIYSSSLISLNVHENYQKEFGGDCNERTFKIPLAGGFEITDNVSCISKYFKEGEEIIIAKDENDWFEKIDYYLSRPDERIKIIEAGRKKVLNEHTYHNRVDTIIKIYEENT